MKDQESIIKRVFTSEVKFVIVVIGFVVGVLAPYYDIKTEIALIKKSIEEIEGNHLTHIQDSVNWLTKVMESDKARDDQQQDALIKLMERTR